MCAVSLLALNLVLSFLFIRSIPCSHTSSHSLLSSLSLLSSSSSLLFSPSFCHLSSLFSPTFLTIFSFSSHLLFLYLLPSYL